MSGDHVSDVLRVCEQALAREGAARTVYLDAACGTDTELRREVEALLAEDSGCLESAPSMPLASTLVLGQRLGPYEVMGKLGAGGMGQVYKARDTRLGRTVAIKVLPPDLTADPGRRRRFEQEARAVSALNDAHICMLYDIGSDNGTDYLVMEYLDGETLAARLRKGPLSLDQALEYATQIADGLGKAHRQGVVHRDLKPGNVFLTTDGQAKILDFGLAKFTGGAAPQHGAPDTTTTAPGTVWGTAAYMSPEQIRGEPIDCRSDIFSYGAVLYEMLSGRRAFAGGCPVETMTAILNCEPQPLPATTPSALDRITRRCLKKSADQRFQAAADIAFALECVSATMTDAEPTNGARPGWRRRIPVVVGRVLLLAMAIAIGVLIARRPAPLPAIATFQAKIARRLPITNARFMPDGQRIVYSAATHGVHPDLFMLSPNVEAPEALGVSNAQLLSVSAKGELALIINAQYIAKDLYSGRLARMTIGSSPRGVMENVREADWSPDGDSLAIIRDLGNGRDRLEFPAGTPLYEATGYLSEPRVSPDGSRVAFFEHQWRFDDRGVVKVIDRRKNAVTLGTEFWELEGLAWTLDSAAVLFSANSSGGSVVQPMLVPASGGNAPRAVLGVPGRLIVHDLGRDGRWLAVREDLWFGVRGKVPSQSTELDLSWLGTSAACALSRDGHWLLMVDVGSSGGQHYGVVLRKTDGSETLRLGEGSPQRLSADGKWVSAIVTTPPQLLLYPTGTGERIRIAASAIQNYASAEWFPDGKRLLVCGSEASRAPRCYEQALDGSAPTPLTAEGVLASVAPDGRTLLLTMPDGTVQLSSTTGEPFRLAAGLQAGDRQIAWSRDSRSIFVQNGYEVPALVERVDMLSGQRSVVGKLAPEGQSAIALVDLIDWVDDGRWYVYNYTSVPSTLFVVSGGVQ